MCSWPCLLQLQMSVIHNIKLALLDSAPLCMEHYSLAWVLREICSVLNISVVRKTSDGRSDPTESFIFSKKGLELVTATRWEVLLSLVAWSQLSQDVGVQDKRSQANPYAHPESPGSCLSSFTLCKENRYSFSFGPGSKQCRLSCISWLWGAVHRDVPPSRLCPFQNALLSFPASSWHWVPHFNSSSLRKSPHLLEGQAILSFPFCLLSSSK